MAFIFSGWNVSKWAGLSALKKSTSTVADLSKAVLSSSDGDKEPLSDWDALMTKMQLTPEKLQKKIQFSILCYRFYASCGLALFLYSFYLFAKFPVLSGLCSVVFSILMFAHAFREHYFVFNCRQKKIKSSVSEWFLGSFCKKNNKSKDIHRD